jgi:hypothetical protein
VSFPPVKAADGMKEFGNFGRLSGGRESPVLILKKEYSMTQREIDRAVAASTGESLSEIRHLGFGIADPDLAVYDSEASACPPLMIDWDTIYPFDVGR